MGGHALMSLGRVAFIVLVGFVIMRFVAAQQPGAAGAAGRQPQAGGARRDRSSWPKAGSATAWRASFTTRWPIRSQV